MLFGLMVSTLVASQDAPSAVDARSRRAADEGPLRTAEGCAAITVRLPRDVESDPDPSVTAVVDAVPGCDRAFVPVLAGSPRWADGRHRALASTPAALAGDGQPNVPPVAPNSIPADFLADTNLIVDSRTADTLWYVKNHVAVGFSDDATPTDRARAIAAIGGSVVGGRNRIAGVEGTYYVRFAGDGSLRSILQRIQILERQPGVDKAMSVRLHRRDSDPEASQPAVPGSNPD